MWKNKKFVFLFFLLALFFGFIFLKSYFSPPVFVTDTQRKKLLVKPILTSEIKASSDDTSEITASTASSNGLRLLHPASRERTPSQPESFNFSTQLGRLDQDLVVWNGRNTFILGEKPHPILADGQKILILKDQLSGQIHYVGSGLQITLINSDEKPLFFDQFRANVMVSAGPVLWLSFPADQIAAQYKNFLQDKRISSVDFLPMPTLPQAM
jgi:hypothetical protein